MQEAKAAGGAGSVVLGELSPNHTYCKRFPFEPDIDFNSREGEIFEIMKKTASMIKSYGALPIGELLSLGEIKSDIGDGWHAKGPDAKVLEDSTIQDAFTKKEIQEHIREYIDRGIETTIVEMQECLMPETTGLYRTAVHDFIDKNGEKYEVNAKVVKIGKDFVTAEQNGQEITLHANTIVNAMGRRAHNTDDLKAAAEALRIPVRIIGDNVKARQIGDAIREGWTAAMEIV